MPGRSFIGVGIMLGLILGAWGGVVIGNPLLGLALGVVVGGVGAWGVDRLTGNRS